MTGLAEAQRSAIVDIHGQPMQRPFIQASAGALDRGGSDTAFAGASRRSRHIGGWGARLESINTEVLRDADNIRARARDLVKNEPLAAQAARIISQSVCGNRLRLALTPNYNMLGISYDEAAAWARIFEGLWEGYAHGPDMECDAGRRFNFTRLMKQIVHARYVDGDAVGVLEYDRRRMINTCIRLVDVDRLSNPLGVVETTEFRGGIEFDDYTAPLRYHIREKHPSDDVAFKGVEGYKHRAVKRRTEWGRAIVLHFYDVQRAEQIRGISAFAPVIESMKMGYEYAKSELATALAQSQIIATLETELNYQDAVGVVGGGFGRGQVEQGGTTADAALSHMSGMSVFHEENPVYLDGERIPVMPPGTKLKLESGGHPSTQYENFQSHLTKRNAAGLGVDSASFSQNFADTSYSAARFSLAHSYRHYEGVRQEAVDDTATPWMHAFAEEVVAKGIMPMPGKYKPGDFYEIKNYLLKCKWITAGKPMIDPAKETTAYEKGLNIHTTTLEEIAAASGKDADEVLEQRARELNKQEEMGLLSIEQQQARAGVFNASVETAPAPQGQKNGQ